MKIGVIGGTGVAATNRLCDMIERKVTAAGAYRDAHQVMDEVGMDAWTKRLA